MKLVCKTLKGDRFTLDVAMNDTVHSVKRLVSSHMSHPEAADGYRLIYSGKVLKDDETMASAGVKEAGFVVVMPPTKQKAAQKTPDAAPSTTAGLKATPGTQASPSAALHEDQFVATPIGTTAPSRSMTTPSAVTPDIGAASHAPSANSGTASATAGEETGTDTSSADVDTSLLTGEAYEASVRQICEMGFPEDQVRRAMRAAFNNPGRAVEYLFSGIPEPTGQPMGPAATTHGAAQTSRLAAAAPQTANQDQQAAERVVPGTPFDMFGGVGARAMGGTPDGGLGVHESQTASTARDGQVQGQSAAQHTGGDSGNLDFLRQLPQFDLMRRMIQAHPGLLPQILQQLDQVNPALLGLINANQEEFVRLINETPQSGDESEDAAMGPLLEALANAGEGNHDMGAPGQVYVTEAENDQLTRLTELGQTMGLHRVHVVEAWLACDRDENMAANYLYDHMEEIRAAQDEEEAMANADSNNRGDEGNPPGPGEPRE